MADEESERDRRDDRYVTRREFVLMTRSLEEQLHQLQASLARMDTHGTAVTNERFKRFDDRVMVLTKSIEETRDERADQVHELKADARALRLVIRGAIITFASSIALQVFIYFLNKASG